MARAAIAVTRQPGSGFRGAKFPASTRRSGSKLRPAGSSAPSTEPRNCAKPWGKWKRRICFTSMRPTEIPARTFGFETMTLRQIVEKYLAIAGGFAFLAPLADFGLEPSEAERIFGALDDDYHISRFFHFSQ